MAGKAAQPFAGMKPGGEAADLCLAPMAAQAGLVLGGNGIPSMPEDKLRFSPASSVRFSPRVAGHTTAGPLQQFPMHALLQDLGCWGVAAQAGQGRRPLAILFASLFPRLLSGMLPSLMDGMAACAAHVPLRPLGIGNPQERVLPSLPVEGQGVHARMAGPTGFDPVGGLIGAADLSPIAQALDMPTPLSVTGLAAAPGPKGLGQEDPMGTRQKVGFLADMAAKAGFDAYKAPGGELNTRRDGRLCRVRRRLFRMHAVTVRAALAALQKVLDRPPVASKLLLMAGSAEFSLGTGREFFGKGNLRGFLLIRVQLSRPVAGLASVESLLALDAVVPGFREDRSFVHVAVRAGLPIVQVLTSSLKRGRGFLAVLRQVPRAQAEKQGRKQKCEIES